MTDTNFVYNINLYTVKELEELLNLKFPYTKIDIEDSLDALKSKVETDDALQKHKKINIQQFLVQAFNKLHKYLLYTANKIEKNVVSQHNDNFIIKRNFLKKSNGIPPAVKINPYRTGPGNTSSMLNKWGDNTVTRLINIDSRFRNQYFQTTSTNFQIDLPIDLRKVIKMTLVSLELPATIFSISKHLGNNFFHIYDKNPNRGFNPPYPSVFKITIPDGHYTREDMQSMLNQMFQTIDWSGGAPGYNPIPPQASIDVISGRVIIDLDPEGQTVGDSKNRMIFFNFHPNIGEKSPHLIQPPGGDPYDPSVLTVLKSVQPIQTKLGWVLGYRLASYDGSETNISVFISEGVYDGWGKKYFYIVVDDFNKNSIQNISAVLNSSIIGGSNNILARLARGPAAASFNLGFTLNTGLMEGGESTRQRIYTGPVTIKKLGIKIIDTYGRVIDLDNMDLSLSLKFDCLYT
jgi:hypothetical protein